MKKYFFTGLTLLLPFVITCTVVVFAVNFLTDPFQETMYAFLQKHLNWGKNLLYFISKIVVLTLLCALVLLIGFLGHLVFMRTFFHFWDQLFEKIPVVRKLYKAIREGINSFSQTNSNLFSQVVFVPFPNRGSHALSIGLTSLSSRESAASEISVFIPSALNPTYGVVLVYKREDLILSDMSVEQAFKRLISCGTTLDSNDMSVTSKK